MKEIKVIGYGLSQMCRLCLSDDMTTTDVFLFVSESGKKLADIIMECAPVHITRHDSMPTCICRLCFTQLKKFHQFQMQVIKSDKTLQRYLQQLSDYPTQVKVEWALEEPSDASVSQTSNTDVDTRCEPFDISGGFDICHSKLNETANSSAVCRNNEEIFFKSEIKDEPIDDNSLLPTEWADEIAESVSNDDGSRTPHRYLQPMSGCHPQIEVELALEEHSNNSKSQNYNADVTTKCKPSEMSDKFDLRYLKKKMPLKSKIKDEPMEDNSLIPTEWAEDGVENVSKDDGSGINCEVSMVVIDDTKAGVNTSEIFQYSLKFENDLTEKMPQKLEETCNTSLEETVFSENLRSKRSKRTGGKKPYQCDVCKMVFSEPHNLKRHKLIHTGEKPYQCDICQMCFRHSNTLKRHILKHTGEKPYQCDICKTCFIQASHLKRHKIIHTEEKPYQCDVCKVGFNEPRNLKRHYLIHTGEKPYQCDICKMSFRHSHTLRNHELKHKGEKPYQCDICKMCFRQAFHLKRHKLKHTTEEKPFQCYICNMGFTESFILKRHNLIHKGEKPYQCEVCKMCFRQAFQLKSHNLKHTGEKPYKCNNCKKSFRHLNTLRNHELKHKGEKPYKCDICQMCFRQVQHLKRHKLKHN